MRTMRQGDVGGTADPRTAARVAADLRDRAVRLEGRDEELDRMLERIGDARYVLLGEASHGTHDFYHQRARITRRLISDRGFNAVAVEADWPDAYRVNCYVRGRGSDRNAHEALNDFVRFPRWMWRNSVVLDFVQWLRSHNERDPSRAVGFYGVDLYSLYRSIDVVVSHLDDVDPEAAERARVRYGCLGRFDSDPQSYGYATEVGLDEPCEDEVVAQLVEIQKDSLAARARDESDDAKFYIAQNARLIKNAELYYRSMFRADLDSWNLRDRHMAETLGHLDEHLSRTGRSPKVVVWEHNSHLGDARATQMGERGELNVGQLVRERHGADAVLIGFTTYDGTVTAASRWGGSAETKGVLPALPDSYEASLHETGLDRFYLDLGEVRDVLPDRRLERAIGVIYLPETERASHYFYADLARQFDLVIHLDRTRALRALDAASRRTEADAPETFPHGT